MSMDPYLWWFYAFWASRALAGAVETGSEVGAAFRGVDQASSVLFAASAQDQDTRFQAPWHLDRIDQADLPLDGQFQTQSNGSGVNIYVVSGGVHKWHQDFTTKDGKSRVVPAYSVHHASPADIDIRGEGTAAAAAAAGLLSGVAKGATLHSVKVFRDETPDFTAPKQDVLNGLTWIRDNHVKPAVVLWLTFANELRVFDADKEGAVRNLTAAGLPVVVPAGFTELQHDGPVMLDACNIAVANSARTLTVSTSSKTDKLAAGKLGDISFSARSGPCVDVYAPGASIIAPSRSPSTSDFMIVTSPVIAPALAAGVMALYLQDNPSATAQQVYEAVMTAATATTVELIVPGTVSNSSAPHARLLNSNLYQNDPAHPRNSGMPSRPLDATLYALNMEYSSGFLRNEIGKALIGVHFAHLVPADLTDHLEIELEDGEILESGAKTMMHVPGNAQGQIVSATLPPGYSGQVTVTSEHALTPLRFQQVQHMLTLPTSAHKLL